MSDRGEVKDRSYRALLEQNATLVAERDEALAQAEVWKRLHEIGVTDRIERGKRAEAAEADRDRALRDADDNGVLARGRLSELNAAIADRDRYKAALERIATAKNGCGDLARAALKDET